MNRLLIRKITLLLTIVFLAFGAGNQAQAQEKKRTLKDIYAEGVRLYEAQQWEAALVQFETFLKYQPNYPYARNYAAQCRKQIKAGVTPKKDLEGALAKIRVPSIQFENTSLAMVFEFLRQKSEELSDGKVVANFIYKGTEEQKKTPVTLTLRDTPLTEVVRYVGQVSGTRFSYEEFAIVATPVGGRGDSPITTTNPEGASLEAKFDSDTSSLKPIPPANQDPFGANR